MNVTAGHVAAVRALVTEDDDAFVRLTGGAGPDWLGTFTRLVIAAFSAAVQFRFAGGASRADITRFVARSRIRHGGYQAGFGASHAEALMGAAAGLNPFPAELDDDETSAALVALLKDLAGELSFLDFELLLDTARAELNKPAVHAGAESR